MSYIVRMDAVLVKQKEGGKVKAEPRKTALLLCEVVRSALDEDAVNDLTAEIAS